MSVQSFAGGILTLSDEADERERLAHDRRVSLDRRTTPREAADRRVADLLNRVREHPWHDGASA